ncbi:ATP-binding cassette domain-containing protein [Streptacidiphilus monticola]
MSADVTVALRGVRKSYGPVTVLDIPELELRRGQIVGVVGENGAGKSTLMGVLSGTVAATAGEILIGGQPLHSGRPDHAQALGVSLVAQEFPLVGRLSVAENLLLGRRTRAAEGGGSCAAPCSTARAPAARPANCWPTSASRASTSTGRWSGCRSRCGR